MNKIFYIGCYDNFNNNRNLNTQPSGITKMNYIKQALKNAGFYVSVFSVAECKSNKLVFNKKEKYQIDKFEDIDYIFSIGRKNIILKLISRFLLIIQLLHYLLWKRTKDDIILIYHSLAIAPVIKLIQIVCTRQIYFEVEEIYQAVYKASNSKIENEINYLKKGKGFIFVNDIIKDKCSFEGKSAICYGNYLMQQNRTLQNNEDEKIHIVYAGVIEGEGTDVYLAMDVAKYLSSQYHVHILGYGLETNINKMIYYLGNLKTECTISYDGCLSGNEYLNFLSKCHIGLCTRVLEDEYSDYAFPSKLLVYLSNNLHTICTPVSAIVKSKISSHLLFPIDKTPESIAKLILSIDINKEVENKGLLQELHNDFIIQLQSLFLSNYD